MEQNELNKVRIDEWDHAGLYEEKFRLKLTAKHELVIGKWDNKEKWGVDLRRWSYDKNRLLGEGITFKCDTWQELYELIVDYYDKGYFTDYGGKDKGKYETEIKIDNNYSLRTNIFEGGRGQYFCGTMHENGKPLIYGRRIAIMIRFDTVSIFISECKKHNLVKKTKGPRTGQKKQIDRTTGKEIF